MAIGNRNAFANDLRTEPERCQINSKAVWVTEGAVTEDFYELLGVPPSADPNAIRAAYRQQMNLYHPDKVEALGPELKKVAEARSKAINTAYTVLGDPTSRERYDRQRLQPSPEALPRPPARATQAHTPQPSSTSRQPPTRRSRFPFGPPSIALLSVVGFLVLLGMAKLAADTVGVPDLMAQIILVPVLIGCFNWFNELSATARRWRTNGFLFQLAGFGIRAMLVLLAACFVLVAFAGWGQAGVHRHAITIFGAGLMVALSLLLLLQSLIPVRFSRLLARFKR